MIGKDIPIGIEVDGIDVTDDFLGQAQSSSSSLLLREREDNQNETNRRRSERAIFFWRDGFKSGPLPAPFGRFDVVTMRLGGTSFGFGQRALAIMLMRKSITTLP